MEKEMESLIQKLKYRNMDAFYFQNQKDAKTFLYSSLLKKGDVIAYGGSMTFSKDMNLYQELKENKDYLLVDREDKSLSIEEINAKTINCDDFFLSTNALTQEGELVNIDGRGNRLCYLTYGPKQVIVLVGRNKIVKDREEAFERIHTIAAVKNAVRLKRDTPCVKVGHCMDCQSKDCICSSIVITRRSAIPSRIKVLLIDENLGY